MSIVYDFKKKPQKNNFFLDPIGSLLHEIQNKLKDNCEFWHECLYFDIESHHCSKAGGSYCGKYRTLKMKTNKIEVSILGKR